MEHFGNIPHLEPAETSEAGTFQYASAGAGASGGGSGGEDDGCPGSTDDICDVGTKLDTVLKELEELKKNQTDNLTTLENKITQVDTSVDGVIDGIKKDLDNLDTSINELEIPSISDIEVKLKVSRNNIMAKISNLQDDIENLGPSISGVNSDFGSRYEI